MLIYKVAQSKTGISPFWGEGGRGAEYLKCYVKCKKQNRLIENKSIKKLLKAKRVLHSIIIFHISYKLKTINLLQK